MSEQLIAARAAIAELIAAHQAHIDRARAALAALDGDIVPMVRPAPTPDVIDPPVTLPKPPQREQRPAAIEGARGTDGLRAAAARRTTCPDCGKEVSQMGIGTHRRMAHQPRHPTLTKVAEPVRSWQGSDAPFTTEPMSREPIDHQAVREAAARAL